MERGREGIWGRGGEEEQKWKDRNEENKSRHAMRYKTIQNKQTRQVKNTIQEKARVTSYSLTGPGVTSARA